MPDYLDLARLREDDDPDAYAFALREASADTLVGLLTHDARELGAEAVRALNRRLVEDPEEAVEPDGLPAEMMLVWDALLARMPPDDLRRAVGTSLSWLLLVMAPEAAGVAPVPAEEEPAPPAVPAIVPGTYMTPAWVSPLGRDGRELAFGRRVRVTGTRTVRDDGAVVAYTSPSVEVDGPQTSTFILGWAFFDSPDAEMPYHVVRRGHGSNGFLARIAAPFTVNLPQEAYPPRPSRLRTFAAVRRGRIGNRRVEVEEYQASIFPSVDLAVAVAAGEFLTFVYAEDAPAARAQIPHLLGTTAAAPQEASRIGDVPFVNAWQTVHGPFARR